MKEKKRNSKEKHRKLGVYWWTEHGHCRKMLDNLEVSIALGPELLWIEKGNFHENEEWRKVGNGGWKWRENHDYLGIRINLRLMEGKGMGMRVWLRWDEGIENDMKRGIADENGVE